MPPWEQARDPRGARSRAAATTAGFTVRLGWGMTAAQLLGPSSDVVVVVDVITFSTAVSVAVDRGCTVRPHAWDPQSARLLADRVGASLAVARSQVDASHPYSLSPATLSHAPGGAAIVLPSPNGSALAAELAGGSATVVAGCLRNAAAVARFARRQGGQVTVLAAGELWGGGTVDPALEDLIGAGAIIDGLRRRRRSPEAMAAAAAYLSARRHGLRRTLMESVSGREQSSKGYAEEMEWASALNVSQVVPVLRAGVFRGER